jgi:hypothetical protein
MKPMALILKEKSLSKHLCQKSSLETEIFVARLIANFDFDNK